MVPTIRLARPDLSAADISMQHRKGAIQPANGFLARPGGDRTATESAAVERERDSEASSASQYYEP